MHEIGIPTEVSALNAPHVVKETGRHGQVGVESSPKIPAYKRPLFQLRFGGAADRLRRSDFSGEDF